jgi:glycosyltransferase involved in cell wall biosynthesis
VRVLYFSRDYSPHDHRFLSAIVDGGHSVCYLRLQDNVRTTENRPVPDPVEQVAWRGAADGLKWHAVPRLVSEFRGVVKRVQPDLIHAGPIQDCALLTALSGARPLLSMSWGFDLMQDAHRNPWMAWATRHALRNSTYFTSDAQVTRDRAINYGVDPERTCVIPWGVDLTHFTPEGRAADPSGPFTILCNRAWEPRYGVDVLARAFVRIARQTEAVSLILLGGGSQAELIRGILSDGGVGDRVRFGGQVPQVELPHWYHMADLYVSPSHVDGASVSLMEALACGLPALVSDIPGNAEWVQDGANGWLFPDGDADALASALLTAKAKQATFAGIGRAARATAEERADWRRNAAQLMQVYEVVRRLI